MTTLYLVCILVGTVGLVLTLIRQKAAGLEEVPTSRPRLGDEVTVPGARVESSDEYAVEGGAGGAEGEGSSLGYEDGADGGIGGAEGGTEGTRVRKKSPLVMSFLWAAVLGFGGGGYFVESLDRQKPAVSLAIALGVGLAGGLIALPVVLFVQGNAGREE